MVEEQYVSLETAKLLKEAKFDIPCTSQYTENEFAWENLRKTDFNKSDYVFSRPTQALAARWLREVHEIDVVVNIHGRDYYMCNVYKKRLMIIKSIESSFEEALEAGLREAIKLIKKVRIMIQKIEAYQAHCDICGIKSEIYENSTKLALMLQRRGWVIKGNSCICSDCTKGMNTNK